MLGLKKKVSSKVSSLSKRSDMLGAIIGYFGTFANVASAENGELISTLFGRHINAVKIHNFNNLTDEIGWTLTHPEAGVWDDLIMLGGGIGLAGLVASYLPPLVPWQSSAAAIAKKGGFGMALGGLAALIVGKLAEGSGGSTVQKEGGYGGHSSGTGVSTTGRLTGVVGNFSPPSPYTGGWAAPG